MSLILAYFTHVVSLNAKKPIKHTACILNTECLAYTKQILFNVRYRLYKRHENNKSINIIYIQWFNCIFSACFKIDISFVSTGIKGLQKVAVTNRSFS